MSDNNTRPLPDFITSLPLADIPIEGLTSCLLQGDNQQVIFFDCGCDVKIPEHCHAAQWGIAIDGQMELTIEGKKNVVRKGDTYFIPEDTRHSAILRKGYRDITFFNQKDRYKTRVSHS